MTISPPTLQELTDRLDVVDVCTRLHWCVDHRDWDGLDALFDEWVSFPTPAELSSDGFDPSDYLRPRAEIKAAYPGLLAGLITQHLIAGHQVELDGDSAVCRAHSINVHVPESGDGAPVVHGNEYEFRLRRLPAGWRIVGRSTWIRWRSGDDANYDVDQRLRDWSSSIPGLALP